MLTPESRLRNYTRQGSSKLTARQSRRLFKKARHAVAFYWNKAGSWPSALEQIPFTARPIQ